MQQLLASKLKSVGSYVLLFDESLTNHMQPDLHIRVWEDEKVATHYFTSRFLGHATAEQLFEELQAWCIEVGKQGIVQLSMDDPNVNWATYKLLNTN